VAIGKAQGTRCTRRSTAQLGPLDAAALPHIQVAVWKVAHPDSAALPVAHGASAVAAAGQSIAALILLDTAKRTLKQSLRVWNFKLPTSINRF
jgi:hypothetical protein